MSKHIRSSSNLYTKNNLVSSDVVLDTAEFKVIDINEEPHHGEITVIHEFKIDGMTCVSCSQTIEGAMKKEYTKQGLISISVALLTHKMRMEFDQVIAN
jgi:copper chaperone CopZ